MDGQIEYAKTIRDINAIMNAAASEYQTHVAAMGKDADATSKLAAEKKKLEIQLEAGKKRTEQLRTEYEALAASSKTTTSQLANKYKQLQNSERAEIALSNALDEVNEGLTEQSEESRKAEAALNKLEQESSQLESQTEKLNAEYKLQEAQLGSNATESDKLKLKMEQLNSTHELAGEKVRNYEEQLEQAKKQYGENSTEVDKYEVQLLEARTAEQQLANEIVTTNGELKKQQDVLNKTSDVLDKTGKKMKDVGKDLSLKVTAPILAMGAVSAKSAIDFESAFAGVRKTVDETEEGFAELSDGIREMSKVLPASAVEIAGVAESAGQLGIQNEHILTFTRTMVDLGVATDMSGEQAATSLARLANITNMSQQDFDRLGATLVDLGNNFAATEGEITEMALRIAGAGSQIQMSEADILGFSAALTSVGINAEAGGTAISKLMIEMAGDVDQGGERLKEFARVAGMSVSDFKTAFEEDAASAIFTFLGGLGDLSEEGESAFKIIDDLGLSEIRLRDTILRTSNARDMANEALKTANTAWVENIALEEEAAERYKTTESQLAMLKNTITDVAIDLGNILIPMIISVVETVRPWIERFAEMDESTQQIIVVLAGLAAAIGPVLMILGSMATGASALITAFTTVSGAIAVVTTGAAAATPAIGALATVFTVLTGPVGLIVAGLAAVTVGAIALGKHLSKDVIPEVDRFGDEVSDTTKEALEGFFELSDGVSQSMAELSITNGKVTEDMKNDIVGKYAEMNTQILEGMATRHSEEVAQMESMFLNTSALTDEETTAILTKKQEQYETEVERLQWKEEKINEILQLAADENRELTEREQNVINNINQQAQEEAVRVLSESEMEQKIILERMKDSAADLSAQQAAEVVKNSAEQREQTVAEAEAQYDETYAAILRMRDETGELSEEQATKLIQEAKKSRDETVKHAEDMHERIVEEAKLQAEEHVDHVDWETGEILSKWDVFVNGIKKFMSDLGKAMSDSAKAMWTATSEWFTNIYKTISDKTKEAGTEALKNFAKMVVDGRTKFTELVTTTVQKFNEVKTKIKEKLVESVTEVATQIGKMPGKVREKVSDMKQAGIDLVLGLIGGIKDMATDAIEAITGVVDGVITAAKKLLKTASPSKVFYEIGKWTIQGEIDGMLSEKDNLEKTMTDLSLMLIDITDHYAKEEIKIRNNANAEITKIEKHAAEDVAKIQRAAATKKRKTTQDENIKIRRIQEDAAKKIATIEKKAAADSHKLLVEAEKEKLKEIKLFIDDKKSLEQLSLVDEARIWEASAKLFSDGTKEKVEAQKAYRNAYEAINKEIVSINKEFSDQMQKINDNLSKNEQALIDDYNKAYSGRVDAIRNFTGLFDEFAFKIEKSGHVLLQNLESQVDGLEDWRETLDSLWGKIDNQALMEELEEMGPKALSELKGLNQLSAEQLEKYSDLYNQKFAHAREQATHELSGLKEDTEVQILELRNSANKKLDEVQSDWTKAIRKITQTTSDEFKSLESIGKKAGQNLLDGLSSMEASLVAKAQSIASAVSNAMAGVLGTPSLNTMELDTQWNAKGGIFTQPTIFGASGGKLQGAGEAGPEAVLPLNDETLGAIGKGIAKAMGVAPITINSRDDAEAIARAVDRVQRRDAFRMG